MNKNRRKEIAGVVSDIESLVTTLECNNEDLTQLITQEIIDQISDVTSSVENIKSEEEDYRDNMPENLQNSERYYAADDAVNNLDSASDYLMSIDENMSIEDAIDNLNGAAGSLEDASA